METHRFLSIEDPFVTLNTESVCVKIRSTIKKSEPIEMIMIQTARLLNGRPGFRSLKHRSGLENRKTIPANGSVSDFGKGQGRELSHYLFAKKR